MPEEQSIKDTLNVIRKALEEDDDTILTPKDNALEPKDNVLILNRLVKDDGTINILNDQTLTKNEIKEVLEKKISELFDDHFEKWLDKNVPNYLDKYFKNK